MKFIFSLIIFALSVVIGVAYVMPEYSAIAQNRSKLTEVTTTLKNKESIKTITTQINDALNSIDPTEQAALSVLLPQTLDEVRFADNLQNIGIQNGLTLTDIRVNKAPNTTDTSNSSPQPDTSSAGAISQGVQGIQKTFSLDQSVPDTTTAALPVVSTDKSYVTTTASFSVVATYSQFLVFLASLEKSLQLINITSLSFQQYTGDIKGAASKDPSIAEYQFSFEIETYSLK